MSRYVDADKLKEFARKCNSTAEVWTIKDIEYAIDHALTADVKPVVRGEWILNCISQKLLEDYDEEYYVECSLCHRTEFVPFEFEEEKMLDYAKKHFPFCHCGADMRGGHNDK